MLDIFKRSHEEGQTPEGPQSPQEPEVPVQVQDAQETAEAKETPQEQQAPQEPAPVEEAQPKIDPDLTNLLEILKQEENSLLSQKQQLVSIGEQLRQKTLDEIEKTKMRISSLKTEIPELKQKCESMAKVLEIPVYNTSD
jgi:predicted RNase H-like nuclease (RuvC/YqgF family)